MVKSRRHYRQAGAGLATTFRARFAEDLGSLPKEVREKRTLQTVSLGPVQLERACALRPL